MALAPGEHIGSPLQIIRYAVYRDGKEVKSMEFETADETGRAGWPITWIKSWGRMIRNLMAAIEQNTEPVISGSDHLQTLAVIEAGYESVAKDMPVKIDSSL